MEEDEFLITGLNNAYAMEKGIEQTLMSLASDTDNFPELRKEIKAHIGQTKRQAAAVEKRIKELGGDVSSAKKWTSQLMSKAEGAAMKVMSYKNLKNLATLYATEHLEIATYKQLYTIAMSIGDKPTARMCKSIMAEEAMTARKIEKLIPKITQKEMVHAMKE